MSTVDIAEVIDSQISVEDNFPSREGFGTPIVVAYHDTTGARTQTYRRAAEALEDYPAEHPIYLAVAAAFAQNPRPRAVKVGRRAGAPTQTIRLTPATTTAGFVYALTIAGVEIAVTVQAGDAVADVCDDLVAAIAASSLAADDDAIMAALATAAAEQVLDTEAAGVIGRDTMSPPRKLTVTRSAHADHDAVTAVLVYVDEYDQTITENLAFVNGGGDSFTSSRRAKRFVSLTIPAQSGNGGTTKIGVAAIVTPTDGTTHVDVAAASAGAWLAYQFDVDAQALLVEDRTANPGTTIQADLAAIYAADADFYGVILADAQSSAQILAAAAWAEANGRYLIADTVDSQCVDGAADTDVLSSLKSAGYHQTAGFYHRGGHGYFPSARWFGKMLPTTPGTETWALKTLAGLPVDDLSATERAALESKNGNYYAEIGGAGRVLGAKKGGIGASGRFIDLTRCVGALNADIKQDAFAVLANADKIPMTDRGMTVIGGAIRAVLKRYETREAIRDSVLTIPAVDDIPSADRADRIASGFEWDAIYTGAAHEVQIRGRLSL